MADDPKPDDAPNKDDDKPDPDAGAKKALDAERKARRDAEKKLSDLQAQMDEATNKGKSDMDKLTEQVQTLTDNLSKSELARVRAEVIADKKLNNAQAKRLTGTSREELETDADDLLEAFPTAPAKGDGKGDESSEDAKGGAGDKPKPNGLQGGDSKASAADVKSLIDAIPPTA